MIHGVHNLEKSEMIIFGGYPVEEYKVQTSDNYILTMYRIPGGRNGKKFNPFLPPVVLVHGMISSSRDFLLMGPNKSIGFILADAGYDVWIPNMRFNEYATHLTKTKSDATYWNFSLDEHGSIDIPESIDRVLKTTKANKIHYMGYSLGATVYIIMCNTRPDLASKMASFIALAPAIYMTNVRPLVQLVDKLHLPKFLKKIGINALVLNKNLQKYLASQFCSPSTPADDVCFALFFLLVGEDYEQVDWEKSPVIFNRFQSIGVQQLEHFVQLITRDTLSKFDYGKEDNLIRYGTEKPPDYNITINVAPVVIYYAENDKLISVNDTNKLANIYRDTNTLMSVRKVGWKKFNHVDYIYAKDVHKYVNMDMLKILDYISYKTIRNVSKIKNLHNTTIL
ncbi:lipase 3-like isoform X1 [Arctopsyche grandis]|uniref:lipase 3-like isoform X1 n=1 Tax=Arctopsyche grandis TaxID=121162 RepID=UPI00406D90E4